MQVFRYLECLGQCRVLFDEFSERWSKLLRLGAELPDGLDGRCGSGALCTECDNDLYLYLVCMGRCGGARRMHCNVDWWYGGRRDGRVPIQGAGCLVQRCNLSSGTA